MKKLFLIIPLGLLLLFGGCATEDDDSSDGGQTDNYTVISALLNSDLTLANSPYKVIEDVEIPAGAVVQIEPGVEIRFDGEYSLFVQGQLLANGLEGELIYFTSNEANPTYGDWQSIVFDSTAEASLSELTYCQIEYGSLFSNTDPRLTGAVVCYYASPTIEHCLIATNQNNGISIVGESFPTVRSNILFANDGFGLSFDTLHAEMYLADPAAFDDVSIQHNSFWMNSSLPFLIPQDMMYALFDCPEEDTTDCLRDSVMFGRTWLRNANGDSTDYHGNTFTDVFFMDEIGRDFTLDPCSPCIDAAWDTLGAEPQDIGPRNYMKFANELRRQILVPGNNISSGTWTVTCDAFFMPQTDQDTLKIGPGVTIDFQRSFRIDFYGPLLADGSSSAPINFTSTFRPMKGGWRSLNFMESGSSGSRLNNCLIEYGSESSNTGQDYLFNGGAVTVRNGVDVRLDGCTIRHNLYYGAVFDSSDAYINCCTFDDNAIANLFLTMESDGSIANSQFLNCEGYGIFLYEDSRPDIINNLFYGNRMAALSADRFCSAIIDNNTIVYGENGGILLGANSDPVISENIIAFDAAMSGVDESYAVQFLGSSNPVLEYNLIHGTNPVPETWDLDVSNLLDDPLFVDPATRDYDLSPGSPALTAGADNGRIGYVDDGTCGN
jgi:parallel beta-helix repeat protein